VTSSMMTGGALSREEDYPLGPQERRDAFIDEELDAAMIDPSLTPASIPPTPSNRVVPTTSSQTPPALPEIQSGPNKLRFLELDEWDEISNYEEYVPSCLHYSIEWKVVVNNKVVSMDTE
jgi:hypothetical protein